MNTRTRGHSVFTLRACYDDEAGQLDRLLPALSGFKIFEGIRADQQAQWGKTSEMAARIAELEICSARPSVQ